MTENSSFPSPPPLLVALKTYCSVKEIFPQFPVKQRPHLSKGSGEQREPQQRHGAPAAAVSSHPEVSRQSFPVTSGGCWRSWGEPAWAEQGGSCGSLSAALSQLPLTRQRVAPAPPEISSCPCYDPGNKTFHSNEQIYSSGTLITKSIKLHFPAGLYHMLKLQHIAWIY